MGDCSVLESITLNSVPNILSTPLTYWRGVQYCIRNTSQYNALHCTNSSLYGLSNKQRVRISRRAVVLNSIILHRCTCDYIHVSYMAPV